MLILAIDSSGESASAALVRDGVLLAQSFLMAKNSHSVTLLPMIDSLFSAAALTPADVTLYAATVGPGSFTGLRIGAAAIKGLAFPTGTPCVGVSTLEALAWGMRASDGIVCALLGARREQYYTALFSVCAGNITRLTEDAIVLASDLDSYLAPYRAETVHLVGDGAAAASSAISHAARIAPIAQRYPAGIAVAEAAQAIYSAAEDRDAFTAEALNPVYLRATQAEREREERLAAENQGNQTGEKA